MKRRKVPSFRRCSKDTMWKVWGHMAQDLSGVASTHLLSDVLSAIRARDFAVVSGLKDSWGIQSMIPGFLQDRNVTRVASDLLLSRFLSKYCPSQQDDILHDLAIRKFRETDESLKVHCLDKRSVVILRKIVSRLVGEAPSPQDLFNHCTHGPGSSADIPYGRRYSAIKWSDLPLRVSAKALPSVRSFIRSDARFSRAIGMAVGSCTCLPLLQAHRVWDRDDIYSIRESNVVTTVPKDSSKRRTIAKEPTWNMFLQLGIHEILSRRIKRTFGINLHTVRENHALARRGSLDASAYSPATIDLSEASDRLTMEVVFDLFPQDWVDWLRSTRSDYSELPDRSISLRKYASMGNGTTFVVQTIIYLAFAILACERSNYPIQDIKVFGDDIILPTGAHQELLSILVLAGLKVNIEKSYFEGPFRETCGVDYLDGVNIRPVFYRRDYYSQDDLQGWLSLRNLLWLWSEEQGVALDATLAYLDSYTENIPLVYASPDLSSGLFKGFMSPLQDGIVMNRLKFEAKSLDGARLVPKTHTGFAFGKLSHDLAFCGSESGSRFDTSSARVRVHETRSPARYFIGLTRETLSWSRRP